MSTNFFKGCRLFFLAVLVFTVVCPVFADTPALQELAKALPADVGDFRRVVAPQVEDQNTHILVKSEYASRVGARLKVVLHRFTQDGRAYELFTTTAQSLRTTAKIEPGSVGTASFQSSNVTGFFKGPHFVEVSAANQRANANDRLALATALAAKLDRGDGEIPVLIKHLPNWEQAQHTAVYLSRFTSLEPIAKDRVLSVVSSEGDADAVLANYGQMRLLIIEFNTPQRSVENDQRIVGRIQELWKLGEPAPSAYRRVGNYAVLVFDAPNEQAAKQLIDQVHYEQVVSWLGENPNILKAAQKEYVRSTLGVLVAVVKASGLALIACLASGALIGALLFTRRRAQQKSDEAFSDAGGMLRLNLDEMTPQTNPARLISRQ